MGDLKLTVPLVGQKQGYDGKPLLQQDERGRLAQHGYMACWYAAAEMVSYYYRRGPRLGLPKVWKADVGLSVPAINTLAAAEGLKVVPRPASGLTRDAILQLLSTYGPLWAAGHYLDGNPTAGHAIVITGVQGNFVYYNDPWEPAIKHRPVEWIKNNLLPLPNALLAKDRTRS